MFLREDVTNAARFDARADRFLETLLGQARAKLAAAEFGTTGGPVGEGCRLLADGMPEEALAPFGRAAGRDCEDWLARLGYAVCATAALTAEEAAAALSEAAATVPEDRPRLKADLFSAAGLYWMRDGRSADCAALEFHAALAIDPGHDIAALGLQEVEGS